MTRELRNVVAIIDMDGYTINKKNLCKKLGFLRVGDAAAQSPLFDIGIAIPIFQANQPHYKIC